MPPLVVVVVVGIVGAVVGSHRDLGIAGGLQVAGPGLGQVLLDILSLIGGL